ncbi:hypothetical protein M408DRAFT_19870, partial [Serendipita vermifera MAFF 305830]
MSIELTSDMIALGNSGLTSYISILAHHNGLRTSIRAAIPRLVQVLKDVNRSVRRAAAAAISDVQAAAMAAISELGKIAELHDGIRPAIPQLIEFLKDGDDDVRAAAAAAISELGKI